MSNGLGRHPHQDVRDGNYLMRSVLSATELRASRGYKVWTHGQILDQGNEGACVGFAWTAWENSKPVGYATQQGNDYAHAWYERAKEIDPWEGTDYEGTATRAGADVALERRAINRYLWAGSVQEVDAWLVNRGPIVVGSNWFRSMDDVDQGFIRVDPSSGTRGGHAYLLLGKGPEGNYVVQNSWGESYGRDGLVRMRAEDFRNLVAFGDAEFCTALQVEAL